MYRPLLFLTLCLTMLAPIMGQRPVSAALPPVSISGTVSGFENGTGLIGLNTRLGLRSFRLDSGTLVLLNNHSGARTDIQVGDSATVVYQYETLVANTIHLFRTARRSGTVGTVTATGVQLRLSRRANLQLQANAASVVEVEGIPITDRGVLTGVRVRAVYEPGTLLLLNLRAESRLTRGRIVTVDSTASTLTVDGRRDLTLAVDPLATIRRSGLTATLEDLAADDRVLVAYVKEGSVLRALAIEAAPAESD